jgi:hypothetical protein
VSVILTEEHLALLARVPDDLSGVAGGFLHPSAAHRELEARGLTVMEKYGSHGGGFVCRYLRTDAGRAALPQVKEQGR